GGFVPGVALATRLDVMQALALLPDSVHAHVPLRALERDEPLFRIHRFDRKSHVNGGRSSARDGSLFRRSGLGGLRRSRGGRGCALLAFRSSGARGKRYTEESRGTHQIQRLLHGSILSRPKSSSERWGAIPLKLAT